ncbi:DEAD/DEAH box helicase [Planctomicrobium sp. SH664]|uniref:DEAD/DEAH box helicase n=1 Tax=Planctomicrobium sp. SH664 TaxID=3448125 RepID=UPI003F5C1AEF
MNPTTFSDLNLLPAIQRALADAKYTHPTPIQAQAIPHLLDEKDLLGSAQTGTGKTAAFALPILNRLGKANRRSVPHAPRVLVLSPTRELAAQIGESFEAYGRHLHVRHTVVFGGVGQGRQVRALQKGVHILVATPGRLLDLMNQGFIDLDQLEVFVLDEADRMLDMGFLPDLKRIISQLPEKRHSLFFSATMTGKIAELANSLLRDPVRVEVTPEKPTVEKIEQQVLFIQQAEKGAMLTKVLQGPDVGKAIVFTRTKRGADKLAQQLHFSGIRAEAIHGNKSQNARTKTLDMFRSSRLQVLVATDLAARGIDVDGLTHVINFDLPLEAECYVHRIGRTGRAGASGIALTFCDSSERGLLRGIERLIRQAVPVHPEHPDRRPSNGGEERPARGRRGRPSYGRPGQPKGQGRRPAGPGRRPGSGAGSKGPGRRPGNGGGKRPARQPSASST